jgi:glycosyltransferase involved in cell wall biosynthesis
MKKILFFMPDNPLKKNAGNKIRAMSFLSYFKSRGFQVHFVSEYSWGEWDEEQIGQFRDSGYADQTTVLKRKASKRNLLYYFFCYKLPNFFYERKWGILPASFPEMVTIRLKRAFNHILKNNEFDYIFINYASWSTLIHNNEFIGNAKTVLDTHDLLSAQYAHKYNLGASFQEEMRRLSLFDSVFAISAEEHYIFEQFSKTSVSLVPMMISSPAASQIPVYDRTFDIIYVASSNPHNVAAAGWFMDKVYPLLPPSVKICIIGQVTKFITGAYANITMVPYADELDPYYQDTKIAICPMLSGTGTKIKVIEAISYGLPVVCNTRGVDGLINKINNGCLVSDTPEGFKDHILSLLNHEFTYEEQAGYAKKTYEAVYELNTCYKKLDQLF